MSGIAGIIHFDGKPVEPGQVEAMTAAMHYRGPDGINHWRRGNVALGQCMLRTTSESLEETQPLTNEDESLVLVMDGRVDNWEELRCELLSKGAVLRTRADAELVLRAYEVWGRDCLPHIDGDFALVIWDARRQAAFCARDRMGNKPIFYFWNSKTFVFSSELQPIVRLPFQSQSINQDVLAEYLAAEWYSNNETLWAGVMRVVAGHCMGVTSSGLEVKQYWTPKALKALPFKNDEEYVAHYHELLTDTIRRLSRSHRSLAIEVSGGLDSSAIYCVADSLRKSTELLAPTILGYTLDFFGDIDANELAYAQSVGAFTGTQIREIAPTHVPLSWFADRVRCRLDFPGFVNGTMAHGLLRQASADGARAILNGSGGDEWLGGGREYYAEELKQGHLLALLKCFAHDRSAFSSAQAMKWFLRYGLFELAPRGLQAILRNAVRFARGTGLEDKYWLSDSMKQRIKERRNNFRSQIVPGSLPRHSQYQLMMTRHDAFLALAREEGERQYAFFGFEPRRPLHTAAFVEFAFSTPARLRIKGDRNKYIHVQALRQVMPESIVERKNKAEFSSMFRRHLDVIAGQLTNDLSMSRTDWVSKEGMARLLYAYNNFPRHGWSMWVLWSLYGSNLLVSAYEDHIQTSQGDDINDNIRTLDF